MQKEAEEYLAQVMSLAQQKGIRLSFPALGLREIVSGAGSTVAVGKSGITYKNIPMLEPVAEIIIKAGTPGVLIHELDHAEKRIVDPSWKENSLADLEIGAVLHSLYVTKGFDYPMATVNQLLSLAIASVVRVGERITRKP